MIRDKDDFIRCFNSIKDQAYEIAVSKGFYDRPMSDGELICMMHAELSEVIEAVRSGNPPDDKLPEFSSVETELADVIIRIMGYMGYKKTRVAEAVVAKIEYNRTRVYLHGKKF